MARPLNIRQCKIPDCEKLTGTRGTARGYCSMHYSRLMRHGDPLKGARKPRPYGGPCVVSGCEREARVRGCCRTHSRRLYCGDRNPLTNLSRPWTPAEDAKLLELPVTRKGAVVAGYGTDFAVKHERTLSAVRTRLCHLRRESAKRWRATALDGTGEVRAEGGVFGGVRHEIHESTSRLPGPVDGHAR